MGSKSRSRLKYSLFDGVCGGGNVYSLFDSREVSDGGTILDIHFLTVGRSLMGVLDWIFTF